jgi:hypothetical protein
MGMGSPEVLVAEWSLHLRAKAATCAIIIALNGRLAASF